MKSLQTIRIVNGNIDRIEKLGNMKNTLRKITVNNCKLKNCKSFLLCELVHKEIEEVSEAHHWSSLSELDLSNNEIEEIDDSICLAQNLQHLTLRHNKIKDIGNNLRKLPQLISINLCKNQISSMKSLHTKLGNVKILNISQNNLTTLEGFSRLFSIANLNVSSNTLKSVEDVKYICQLPCLEELVLTGNPVSTIVDYRAKILELFDKKAWEICLDNEKSTQKELDKVAVLQALRMAREGRLPTFPISPPMPSTSVLLCGRPDVGSIAKE